MKLKLYTLICISALFLFSACEQEDDPVPAEKVSRTVLVYIMGDNGLSNFASADINEMMEGMKSVDASLYNLLVYVDDNSKESSSSYVAPTLYRLSKDKKGNIEKEVIKEYKEQVSTAPSVFQEVLTRAYSQYPAESYGLVLWSHGEGWIPSPLPAKKNTSTRWIGVDETDGDNYLNITDMASAFSKLPHLEFILFDACFGQAIEVAYELRQYTDYVIGSPTEIPGPGAPYNEVVPAMFAATNVGEEVGKAYYKPYAKIYTGVLPTNDKWTGGVSVSVIKCTALEELASVTKQTLKSVDLNTLLNNQLYNYDQRDKYNSSFVGYYDMKQLMQLLSTDIDVWTSAANNAIVYWKTTPKNFSSFAGGFMFSIPQETTCGVSHYIPTSTSSAATTAYRSTAWYTAAGLEQIGW